MQNEMTINYFKAGNKFDWCETFVGTLAVAKRFVDAQFAGSGYSFVNIESKGGTVLYVKRA